MITTQVSAGNRLENKVSIIPGCSQGIGKGIAHVFASEGAHVVLVSRTESKLKNVAAEVKQAGGSGSYIVADITDPIAMKKMVDQVLDEYGRIDVLVHNAAGIYPPARIDVMTLDEWHEAIQTKLNGTFYGVKAVVPAMKR